MATEARAPRLAVLIDADNTSPRIASGLFEEIAKIGEASVRRIYGDFSGSQLRPWAKILSTHAIMPHQNFAYTPGKNASDIALVIDAMDLLHSGRFEGFCLVSSDSDFTRLAARIREQGVDVYGFGEQKTPESFRQPCRRFVYTENLLRALSKPDQSERSGASKARPWKPQARPRRCCSRRSHSSKMRMPGCISARSASAWRFSPPTSIRAPTVTPSWAIW